MEKVIESIEFAKRIKAEEVIFLSTFIPFINVDFYEEGWLGASKKFWEEVLNNNNNIKISLCNTFESDPEYLINIIEHVNKDNFGLAFDIGHALVNPYNSKVYGSFVSTLKFLMHYIKTMLNIKKLWNSLEK